MHVFYGSTMHAHFGRLQAYLQYTGLRSRGSPLMTGSSAQIKRIYLKLCASCGEV